MEENLYRRVETLAWEVRRWAEEEDKKEEYPTGDLNGWCAIASAELSSRLSKEGIKHVICMSESHEGGHVFLLVEDHVVDVTATQFLAFAKTPVVIAHEKKVSKHRYYQFSRVFEDPRKLRKYQRTAGWPAEQVAY